MKIQYNELIDVYKYLYNKKETDISIHPKLGLVLGILDWSTLSGEVQGILKKFITSDNKETPIITEINNNLIKATPKKGTEWVLSNPVSKGDSLSLEYTKIFFELAEKSIEEQRAKLVEQLTNYERYLSILDIKEPNLKAIIFCRTLKGTISETELNKLLILRYGSLGTFAKELSGSDEFLNYLLEEGTRHIPGRVLKLGENFPWLFPKKEE